MNDFLDNAAVRSAQVVKAVSKTAFVGRLRYRAAVVRAMAETFRELAEPRIEQQLREGGAVLPSAPVETASAAPLTTLLPTHGPISPAPDGPFAPGDDEKCTCRGTGDLWCGATKRDVVHDLMTTGAHLSAEQADFIWTSAQAKRAEEASA